MILIKRKSFPLIILYAVLLHTTWAACAFISDTAYNATAFSAIFSLFGYSTPYVCLTVAGLACWGLFVTDVTWGFVLMMPQQMLLLLSAFGALHSMIDAQFADGVVRSREFIVADQIPALMAAIAHTLAMIRIALNRVIQ